MPSGDGLRREILDGELIVTPSPTVRHQRVALRIWSQLDRFLAGHDGGEVFAAPLDVLMSDGTVVQPDVFVVTADQSSIVGERNVQGVPALIIEVLSHPRTDRVEKRDVYARHGVAEYWIADPDTDRIEVWRRRADAGDDEPLIIERPESLATDLLPGFALDLTLVFAR